MRIGKRIWMLAALCLCCSIALADGTEASRTLPYGTKPDSWMTQEQGENPEYLIDGNAYTVYQHNCRNSSANDSIPEIMFYFSNATLKDIWIRNGDQSDMDAYYGYARIRRINVSVYTADGTAVTYPYQQQDVYAPDAAYAGWVAGYQRIALPQSFRNVTRVEIWIPEWQRGNVFADTVCISDIIFSPEEYGSSSQPVYQPTPQPSADSSRAGYHPQVKLKQRLATRSGPGTQYTELGSYFQAGETLTAVSAAYDDRNGIWWIQTEFTYLGEKRRAYTGLKRLDMKVSDVPQEYVIRRAVVNRSVYAYWGPGYEYTMHKNPIPAGTEGTVWQTENGYAQLEFYDSSEGLKRRAWIPESALETYNP